MWATTLYHTGANAGLIILRWRMLKLRGHGAAQVWATTLYHTGVNAGLIILRVASLGRDAQNERDGAGAAQLRRTSDPVAPAAPPQQH